MAGNTIPNWLKGSISDEDLPRIQAAVQKAEARTSAEIVPLIVRRSSVIGHLPLTITLLLSFFIFVLAYEFQWLVEIYVTNLLMPLVIVFCAVASFPLSKWPWLQRILIPNADETRQSLQRAWQEFAAMKISGKKNRKGILLFVSMMERKVVVLPDEGLAEVLTFEETAALANSFGSRLRRMPWGQAFEETLQEVAEKLEKVLPRDAAARDELGNSLQIKE